MTVKKYKLKKGLNDCTNDDYHGDKGYLSSSNLKTLLTDVEKFKNDFIDGNGKSEQKNVFDEGNYCHSLILEPENIPAEYAFFPGFRKAGKDWKQFKSDNAGKIILSKPQKHRVEQWFETYSKHEVAKSLVAGGKSESSLAGEYMEVPIKVRADYINSDKGYIADVKTTGYNTDVDSFKFTVSDFKYDLSAALYLKMFEEYYGKKFEFFFIVLGKKDNSCEVFKLSDESRRKGYMLIMQAMSVYKKHMKSGDWKNKASKEIVVIDDDYEILEV